MKSNTVHTVLIALGAGLAAAGVATGLAWLTGIGTTLTALAGASGTWFAPGVSK